MTDQQPDPKPRQKVFATLKSDMRRGDLFDSMRREILDTREFLLDEERRKKIERMNPFKGWLLSSWWMLKALFSFRAAPGNSRQSSSAVKLSIGAISLAKATTMSKSTVCDPRRNGESARNV